MLSVVCCEYSASVCCAHVRLCVNMMGDGGGWCARAPRLELACNTDMEIASTEYVCAVSDGASNTPMCGTAAPPHEMQDAGELARP